MMGESATRKADRVLEIINLLDREFPGVKISLNYQSPLDLLVATILSAQCTDERVNRVTETLFRKYRTAMDYADADTAEFENDIRPTGFFRNKARNIQACCRALVENWGGEVPSSLDELVALPGIGRKTANVVLGGAFGIPGIVVDTHVGRVSRRLGLTIEKDPVKVEFELMKTVPREDWSRLSLLLIHHGRRTCKSRRPLCSVCTAGHLCPSAGEFT